jgi:SAM-dependent methyltransferase
MSGEARESMKSAVRDRYARIAASEGSSCCAGSSTCGCGPAQVGSESIASISARLGYSPEELAILPQGADLGLGCGNPQAIAAIRPGETVLDLGSGAGFDCFLASRRTGASGWVIGVDMTPEMVARAKDNAAKGGFANVEFRLGELEALPVADSTVDVILSNCVVNLVGDKARAIRESFRVLKPGGRIAISDVVATADIPEDLRTDPELFSACAAGAATIAEWQAMLESAGFEQIRITPNAASREFIREWVPGTHIEDYIVSASIEARRP